MQRFDHEKLDVYHKAIEFVAWAGELCELIPRGPSVRKQLDRASTSIPLNIAEGNGKHTAADRCRYFDIARGSALESAASLDVLVAKQWRRPSHVEEGKSLLHDIVSMLVGLIRANSEVREV